VRARRAISDGRQRENSVRNQPALTPSVVRYHRSALCWRLLLVTHDTMPQEGAFIERPFARSEMSSVKAVTEAAADTDCALRPFGRMTMRGAPGPTRASGIVLIVVIGLLNFHIPHFLIEPARNGSYAAYVLEVGLLANVLGAVIAAVGIYLGHRWGWLLGSSLRPSRWLSTSRRRPWAYPGSPRCGSSPAGSSHYSSKGCSWRWLAARCGCSAGQSPADRRLLFVENIPLRHEESR
jgi:hypothetical protein